MVAINPPPPPAGVRPTPVFKTLKAESTVLRLLNPSIYAATALGFRHHGPFARFDHHRFVGKKDPDRGILYAGKTISCCLVEIFGDSKIVETDNWILAQIKISRDLKFLDLHGAGAMRAGTVSAVCMDSNKSFSQAWSRYFYESAAWYTEIDGIAYPNAHNGEDSFAIFERAASAMALVHTLALSSAALRKEILLSAAANSLTVAP